MKPRILKPTFSLLLVILISGFTFVNLLIAQDVAEKSQSSALTQEAKNETRIVISTSGPAKFSSHWLDKPPRLVIEFQTRNIVSKIDSEVIVNQGVIKKINSEYFPEGKSRLLKSLTFELTQKVPYKIWQELDTIILDIQTPPEASVFPEDGKEVFAKNETKDIMIKRLERMDAALAKVSESHPPLEAPKIIAGFPKSRRKSMVSVVFWSIGLISGLGFLLWLLWRRYRLIIDKNVVTQEIAKLKSELQEKNKLLEHKQIIYKAIEDASRAREKEFEQLQLELQKEAKLLEQEEKAHKTVEEELARKGKEYEQLKDSFNSLKDVLLEKGLVKELTSPEEKGMLWIIGKSPERRCFSRLDLSRDYNRTIILRIESQDKSKSVKSFANNIGMGGLCFETRSEFGGKEIINLRLFFFGDKVPMMKIKAKVIWEKTVPPVNYCGISFISLEEKDKTELNHYIESKIVSRP